MAHARPKDDFPETPKWLFSWRRVGTPAGVKFISLLLPAGFFAVAFTSLRVGVPSPAPWVPKGSSVIQAAGAGPTRELALLAQENGPFPAKAGDDSLLEMATMDQEMTTALRGESQPHELVPRALPESSAFPPAPLSGNARAFFPPLPAMKPTVEFPRMETLPVLDPIAGITKDAMPASLPALGMPVDDDLADGTWRFLVRLRQDGSVIDALSLKGGDEDRTDRSLRLTNWLKTVRFLPSDTPAERFVGVGLRFINQPDHGPESR